MAAKSSSAKIIDEVVSLGIAPIMCEQGYKKLRHHFFKHTSEFSLHLVVQSSQFNAPDRARFTIKLWSYLPEVAKQNGEIVISDPQKQRHGHAGIGIGHLLPVQAFFWWHLASVDDVQGVANDVEKSVREYALPYLNKISTLKGIAELSGRLKRIGKIPTLPST